MTTALQYSILESSKLEGIHTYTAKFKDIFRIISSRTYDALNHRKPDFDHDYDIFKESIAEAEAELREFKEQTLNEAPNLQIRLMLIKRWSFKIVFNISE